MKIPVGISNRHVHLTKEDAITLFGYSDLHPKWKLNQIGQFASEEQVTLVNENFIKEFVRVIGPARKYTQVELIRSDKDLFKINPPYRDSGHLENSENIIIKGPKGEVNAKSSVILARKHIHMTKENTKYFNVKDKDIVNVKTEKGLIITGVIIKESKDAFLEFHVDKDEAIEYNITQESFVEIIQ